MQSFLVTIVFFAVLAVSFGATCKKPCHGQRACLVNNWCACKDAKIGRFCSRDCPPYRYGPGCLHHYHCGPNCPAKACTVNGCSTCKGNFAEPLCTSCKPGWEGTDCHTALHTSSSSTVVYTTTTSTSSTIPPETTTPFTTTTTSTTTPSETTTSSSSTIPPETTTSSATTPTVTTISFSTFVTTTAPRTPDPCTNVDIFLQSELHPFSCTSYSGHFNVNLGGTSAGVISLPGVVSIGDGLVFTQGTIQSINVQNLQTVTGVFIISALSGLQTFSAPSLQTINGDVTVGPTDNLGSLYFGVLQEIRGSLTVSINSGLGLLSMPQISIIQGSVSICYNTFTVSLQGPIVAAAIAGDPNNQCGIGPSSTSCLSKPCTQF